MSITPTKLSNPCAICDDASGKCRQGKVDSEYWQCMTYADTAKGAIENGFKCIGHSKNGMWAQFKPDNSQEWTQQQRLDWQHENQRRQQQKASEDEQRQQRSLSAVERNKGYQQLLSELVLHPDDRADLVKRGFSNAQIELSGFRSVKAYQHLQGRYSELLPGIVSGKVITTNEGYLCPVRNADGLIVACQVRLRSLSEGDKNRYRWLSTKEQTLQIDGELPLAIFQSGVSSELVALVEGTGAKPFLVNQRLGLKTIGAAGGLFASSPNILRGAIGGAKSLLIFPDAGDVANRSVMIRWEKVADLLKAWGYQVKFGWWGQFDKTHPDIDELEDYSKIQFLSVEEFLVIRDSANTESITEPATPQFPNIPRFDWWWKNRQLTGATQINQAYVNLPLPEDNSITFIKSGTGTGKTSMMKRWVDEWRHTIDCAFLVPGYRNSLLRQISEILGIRHIHESDIRVMSKEPGSGVAFCIQSILKIDALTGQDHSHEIVILDEIMSVVRDLLTGKTVKNRPETIAKFKQILSEARLVVCLDATLADWCVDFIAKCAPDKKVVKFENTYKGSKPKLNLLLGTVTEDISKIKKNDRSPFFRDMLDSIVSCTSSDSQVFLEGVDKILSASGKKTLRVDSKTIGNEITKEFLKNSNACLLEHKPDCLSYSPSAESGLDISVKAYFTHHFGFFFGVQGTDAILQMMGRNRDADCEKYVWIKEYIPVGENAVGKSLNDLLLKDLSTALSTEESLDLISKKIELLRAKNESCFATDTAILINEISNFEMANLRICTREAFVEAGYKVIDCTLEGSINHTEQEKEVKEEVKQEVSEAIFKAEQIPIDGEDEWKQLEDLKQSENLEDRWKVENAFLRKRLPGIEKTSVWSQELVYLNKFEERDFISHCENYWLLLNSEIAKSHQMKNLADLSQKDSIFLPDYRSRWATIHALKELGIEKFLSEGGEWHEGSPELKELVKAAPKYANALGCKPTNEKGRRIKYLGKLLDKLGLKLKSEKRRSGTARVRFYRIDEARQNNPFRVAALQSIAQKWDVENAKNEAEKAIEQAIELISKKQRQTHTGQGLEGGTLVDNNVYIFESNVPPIISDESQLNIDVVAGDLTQNDVLTPAEELVEILIEYADSPEMFQVIVEDNPESVIEAALIAAPTAWLRQRWSNWYEIFITPYLEKQRAFISDF